MQVPEDVKQKVEYYAGLPYTTAVHTEKQQDGTVKFVAAVVELPDCCITCDTPEEAVQGIEKMKPAYFEKCAARGGPVPLPLKMRNLSGKFQVRISPALHEAIAIRAELDGISLNSYVNAALSRIVGQEEALEILVKDSPAAAERPAFRIRTKK